MQQNISVGKSVNLLRWISVLNFNAALLFVLYVSLTSFQGESQFFADESELYGPMMGNFRLMLIYLCVTEIAVYSYCRLTQQFQGILIMGIFVLLLMVSIDFYGFINQVPVDDNYSCLFLYLGLSHLCYAGIQLKLPKPHPQQ